MTYAATVLADSPLAYWKLDDATASATAADSSGNGRTGTVTNWNFQQAAQFPGSSMGSTAGVNGKIVSSASIAFGSAQVTVEAWVNLYGLEGIAGTVMLFSFGTNYLDLILENGRMGFNTGAGDKYGCPIPPPGLHHIVVVFPNAQATTNGKIYIDGIAQTMSGVSGTAPTLGTCTVQVSNWPPGGQALPSGVYVDEVAVYAGALSATRVLAHYTAGIANDAFASAFALVSGSPIAIDTTSYGTETSEPLTCPKAATAWATFTPGHSSVYQIDTIGSTYDTGLSVYTGSTLTNLARIAYDDDSGGSGTSRLVLELSAGVTYYIQAGAGASASTLTGTLQLTVTDNQGYNGFGYAWPTGNVGQASVSDNIGTVFTTSRSGQRAVGARLYILSGASGDPTGAIAYLYAVSGGVASGSPLATATFPTLTKGGWTEVRWTTPVALTAGAYYCVAAWVKANLFLTVPGTFNADVPAPSGASGLLFPISNSSHNNGLIANSSTPGALPATVAFQNQFMGIDVILDTGAVSMGWSPSL